MSKNSINNADIQKIQEDEISPLDILRFFEQSWKIILLLTAIGPVVAVIYLLTAPKQYEAIAQIYMAQIYAAKSIAKLAPVNIEEPSQLMARFSMPTTFTPSEIIACELEGKEDAGAILAKLIKINYKSPSNIVEIKKTGSNRGIAKRCVNAIFELVKTSQDRIANLYIEKAKIKLANYQVRLAKEKDFLLKADNSGSVMGAAYLSSRDQVRILNEEISELNDIISIAALNQASLVAPIYVSHAPISPKKYYVLVAGLLGGFFLGLLIALLRQIIYKINIRLHNHQQTQ